MRWELSGVYVCRLTYGAHVHLLATGVQLRPAHAWVTDAGCLVCARGLLRAVRASYKVAWDYHRAGRCDVVNMPYRAMTSVWVKTWYINTKNLGPAHASQWKRTFFLKGTLANVKGTGKTNVLVLIVQVLIHQWRTSFSSCILCGCVKWHQRSLCRAVSFLELLCNVLSVCSAALHVCLFGRSLLEQIGFNVCSRLLENCILD